MSVLYHLAAQREALFIPLQETHCTSAQMLVLPNYQLAGFSLSRKHGFATFVHKRLKWTIFDKSPPTSETEWLRVDVDGYKVVNIYKPPPIWLQLSNLPVFPHPCLYACLALWPYPQAAEISAGQAHGPDDHGTCLEQKLNPDHW